MTNRADKLARWSIEALFANRYDEWAATLDDYVVLDDRRLSSAQVFVGKRTVIEEFGRGAYGALGPRRESRVDTVTCRGENLVLLRGTNTVADSIVYGWMSIDRVTPSGLVDLIILFDSDAHDEAITQLNDL